MPSEGKACWICGAIEPKPHLPGCVNGAIEGGPLTESDYVRQRQEKRATVDRILGVRPYGPNRYAG